MYCGRCCVMGPHLRPALRLDIFIEILLGSRVNKACSLMSYLAGMQGLRA
jgi:hypothetical protein